MTFRCRLKLRQSQHADVLVSVTARLSEQGVNVLAAVPAERASARS